MMVPYGINKNPLNKNYAEGKTKMAAWMVSHCETPSEREKWVILFLDEIKNADKLTYWMKY